MFAEMVSDLGEGKLPEVALLRGRCHAAVTKKLAFVRLPPVYWENDPKRNPDTRHLLWAILLLQDQEMLDVLKGIILMEQAEREGKSLAEFMEQSLKELFELAPDAEFREELAKQVAGKAL